jgi:hypothetical protein
VTKTSEFFKQVGSSLPMLPSVLLSGALWNRHYENREYYITMWTDPGQCFYWSSAEHILGIDFIEFATTISLLFWLLRFDPPERISISILIGSIALAFIIFTPLLFGCRVHK